MLAFRQIYRENFPCFIGLWGFSVIMPSLLICTFMMRGLLLLRDYHWNRTKLFEIKQSSGFPLLEEEPHSNSLPGMTARPAAMSSEHILLPQNSTTLPTNLVTSSSVVDYENTVQIEPEFPAAVPINQFYQPYSSGQYGSLPNHSQSHFHQIMQGPVQAGPPNNFPQSPQPNNLQYTQTSCSQYSQSGCPQYPQHFPSQQGSYSRFNTRSASFASILSTVTTLQAFQRRSSLDGLKKDEKFKHLKNEGIFFDLIYLYPHGPYIFAAVLISLHVAITLITQFFSEEFQVVPSVVYGYCFGTRELIPSYVLLVLYGFVLVPYILYRMRFVSDAYGIKKDINLSIFVSWPFYGLFLIWRHSVFMALPRLYFPSFLIMLIGLVTIQTIIVTIPVVKALFIYSTSGYSKKEVRGRRGPAAAHAGRRAWPSSHSHSQSSGAVEYSTSLQRQNSLLEYNRTIAAANGCVDPADANELCFDDNQAYSQDEGFSSSVYLPYQDYGFQPQIPIASAPAPVSTGPPSIAAGKAPSGPAAKSIKKVPKGKWRITLKDVMADPILLARFRNFTISEFAVENLLFIETVADFKTQGSYMASVLRKNMQALDGMDVDDIVYIDRPTPPSDTAGPAATTSQPSGQFPSSASENNGEGGNNSNTFNGSSSNLVLIPTNLQESLKAPVMTIYSKFIKVGSPYELNINGATRKTIEDIIFAKSPVFSLELFDEAEKEVYRLLNSWSLPRFLSLANDEN